MLKKNGSGALRAAAGVAVIVLLFAVATAPAGARAVDHIVAAVNNDIITVSELDQAVALNERLGKPSAGREALQRDTLAGLINRRLLVQEAERLKFVEVSEGEVGEAVGAVKARFGSDAAFAEFLKNETMTEADLGRMLREQILVEKFTAKKVALFVRVTREDAERYFTDHADRFSGKRFPEVQKAITGFLTDEKINQQLDAYLAELRSRADIRMNGIAFPAAPKE